MPNPWREVVEDMLRARDGDNCSWCGYEMGRGDTHIHHTEGSNELSCLVLLHPACHMALHGEARRKEKPTVSRRGRLPYVPSEAEALALERVRVAQTMMRSLQGEYQESVWEARQMGLSMPVIGRAIGVSRQAVDQVLQRHRRRIENR